MGKKIQYVPHYGDLTELNTSRILLDVLGSEYLTGLVRGYVDLLGSSAAICEANGDYAAALFSSEYCRFLDAASRRLCGTDDNAEAMASGEWHCHESCWAHASKVAIETGKPCDLRPCLGGVNIYAVPVISKGKVFGALNFGYGTPPTDKKTLREIGERYQVDAGELRRFAEAYEPRPDYVIMAAKHQIETDAETVMLIYWNKKTGEKLPQRTRDLKERVKELTGLYVISNIVERPNTSLEEMFQEIVDILPPAWHYPKITCARITFGDLEFTTGSFKETVWKQASDIFFHEERAGAVEVFYLKEKPELDEGPFLREERDLINAIAARLGKVTERKWAEEALHESEERYRNLIELSPDAIFVERDGVVVYVNANAVTFAGARNKEDLIGCTCLDFLHPDSQKISMEYRRAIEADHDPVAPFEAQFVRLDGDVIDVDVTLGKTTVDGEFAVQLVIRDISESKQSEIMKRLEQLTRRERQVMKLVVAGETNKMISYRLHISPKTVEGHRAKVMRKTNAKSLAGLIRMAAAVNL